MRMFLLTWIVVWYSAVQAQDNMVTVGGILKINLNKNVIIAKDSILITIIYDLSETELMWNEFIEKCENVIASLGNDRCLNKIVQDSQESRFLIKKFVSQHKKGVKMKRQTLMGLIGGVTSIVSLGLTTYELNAINNKIAEIKNKMNSNEGNIETLTKITKYNTREMNRLKNLQIHNNELFRKIKIQLLDDIEEINKLKITITCLTLKMSYIKLADNVNNIMNELRNLLEYNFDKNLLTYQVKKQICESLEAEGHLTYGICTDLDLITEINYLILESKMVIITKIPLRSEIDHFNLTKLIALPVKVKDKYFKAKDIAKHVALGRNLRTNVNINDCKKYKNNLFCKSSSEYRSVNESRTCMGSIINENNRIFWKVCNFEEIMSMNDVFENVEGTYYYSINGSRVLELLCLDNLDNAQIILEGLGSIKIKSKCYAKLDSLLLTGSNTFTLNSSFHISRFFESNTNVNISLLSKTNIKNLTFTDIKITDLESNQLIYNYHIISIYSIISFGILIIALTVTFFILKKKYLDRPVQAKVDSVNSSSLEINNTSSDNNIPNDALKLAKKAKNKRNSK